MDSPSALADSSENQDSSASLSAQAANAAQGASTVHKRTYQACLPCRHRKVRCDLGSVDEPGDPPCQRCRREKKDCVFSETRRKRKADDEGGGDLTEDYIARNKRSSTSFGAGDGLSSIAAQAITSALANGGSSDGFGAATGAEAAGGIAAHMASPTIPTVTKHKAMEKPSTNRVTNETAAALFQGPILQPADALRMLVDAASRTETESRRESAGAADRERMQTAKMQGAQHRHSTGGGTGNGIRVASGGALGADFPSSHADTITTTTIDPAIMAMQDVVGNGQQAVEGREADLALAMQAWSTVRFVRAGWFMPREAISYIDYFYEHLQPLTPVSPPDFSAHASHPRMLTDEPMLTVTLLTIASRYKKLKGPGGEIRSLRIHDKLWDYLQGMITRMFWGQEQFGGGFCGAGASRTVEEVEAKRRGLRSLGTAESLLLLSDWLPRSMHFPPGDDGDELITPYQGSIDDMDFTDNSRNVHAGWTEPAIRSDRMCWSLVGMAYTLSFELGVFDSLIESGRWSPGPQAKTGYDSERADRIGRMLLVYVSQTCGRLGYPNIMPSQGNETNYNFLKMDVPPGTFPGPYDTITTADKIQRAWAELTALMRSSNTEMFESKSRTHASIQSGEYIKFLESYGPKLRDWKTRFEATEIPPKARTMLLMEYEYTRTYVNSLSLQAVVEACAAGTDDASPTNLNPNSAHTPPALFSSKLVDVHKQNRVYIDELVESARNLLRHAVDGLLPSGALRHAPVRTHFRILSGAMFLLKSFALGAKESEVITSITLLEATIAALRSSVIDDVHLSLRIAELLAGLTATIRRKFVRLAVPPRSTKRPGHVSRSSTSNRVSASKHTGATSSSVDRRHSAFNVSSSSGLAYQQQTQAAQQQQNNSHAHLQNNNQSPFSPSFPSNTTNLQDDFYGNLGFDLAPPLVDLKDPSITIMPPPDFISNFPNDLYPPLSPLSASDARSPPTGHNNSNPLPSPTIGSSNNPPNSRPQTAHSKSNQQQGRGRQGSMSSSSRQQVPPFSPGGSHNHQNNQQPFSPLSTGSANGSVVGGYDWFTLDFNPLRQAGNSLHFGSAVPGGSSGGGGGGSGSGHALQQQQMGLSAHHLQHERGPQGEDGDELGGGEGGLGASGGAGQGVGGGGGAADIANSPWTMGAFGPEISDGLEMLGALGALGWDDNGNGSAGGGFGSGGW